MAQKESTKNKKNKGNIAIYIFLTLGSVVMIFPFVWMITTSFKTVPETTLIPPTLFPRSFKNIKAYQQVTNSLPFLKLYYNTLMMIVLRVLCAVIFSSMAAYAFAKLKFPLKNIFFFIVLSQLMLPAQVFILPQYEMIRNGTNRFYLCSRISGDRERFRYILFKTDLYGNTRRPVGCGED